MVSRKLKSHMQKAWKEYKKKEGTPSLADAEEAFSFGVIDKREFKRVKDKYTHHALSK